MISRRAFLSALAALPFMRKLIPQEAKPFFAPDGSIPQDPQAVTGWDLGSNESYTVFSLVDRKGICAQYDFEQREWIFYRQPQADLSDISGMVSERIMSRVEFAKRYQG